MKTPGQVAHDAFYSATGGDVPIWERSGESYRTIWESAAAAVLEEFSVRPLNASSNPEPPKTGCTVHFRSGEAWRYPDATSFQSTGHERFIALVDNKLAVVCLLDLSLIKAIDFPHPELNGGSEWKFPNETPADPQETLSETQTQTTEHHDDSDTTN